MGGARVYGPGDCAHRSVERGGPMNRESVDEALAGLGAAHDRIAAAMFTIDSHPGLALLRSGGLGGATPTPWGGPGAEIDRPWAHFAVLGGPPGRGRAIRNPRPPRETRRAPP